MLKNYSFNCMFAQTICMSLHTITDFLQPVNTYELSNDEGYKDTQIGRSVFLHEDEFPDIEEADLVIVGCGETRGAGIPNNNTDAPDAIRKEFYSLYHWHNNIKLADVGNVRSGESLNDTYAALKAVVSELLEQKKRVVILGGSHDVTLAQYNAYGSISKIIEATAVDARIDLNMDSVLPADHFLMEMLTGDPNYIRHYNHIGFQSYFVHPKMLETIDKLRFDCYRVGRVKENIEEMEPVVRNSHMLSFDIAAIQHAHAPANRLTPNGFTGEEACILMQYAGMAPDMSSIGIYGYNPSKDLDALTAKQISHMLWYLMDGVYRGKQEATLQNRNEYNEYRLAFAEVEATFLQSKRTGRWWMHMPDGRYIACSHYDYITAASNDIPERWMRAVERS
jgi:arginase family enzyme